MRRKPFGKLLPSAHAVDREYRLLFGLHPLGFPVPQPLALCDDPEVIGAIFYVMELAADAYANGALPEFDSPTRRSMYEQMIDTLADLHVIDPDSAALGDFGKPGNYFERQVARWTAIPRQPDRLSSEVERLIAFLPESVAQSRTSIVHGDYRIDNVVFDGRNPDRGPRLGAGDARRPSCRFLLPRDAVDDASGRWRRAWWSRSLGARHPVAR